MVDFFFFKQKTAYEIGLGIPAEPLFRSFVKDWFKCDSYLNQSLTNVPSILSHFSSSNASVFDRIDRKSGSAGMPRPISYAVFCLKKKNSIQVQSEDQCDSTCFRGSCAELGRRALR